MYDRNDTFSYRHSSVVVNITTLSIYIICDILPICCILFFHSRNFKVIKFMSHISPEFLEQQETSSVNTKTTRIDISLSQSAEGQFEALHFN